MQRDALKSADLSEIYQGLNLLGSTPWQINTKVLDVIEEARKRGGAIGEIPRSDNFLLPNPPTDDDPEIQKKWKERVMKLKQKNMEMHSLRSDLLLKLAVAHEMKNEEAIYFPHNLDFRGRAYPIPPHLNHMGNDLCRGLLKFSTGKPLGNEGVRWLKIHLSNLFGNNKISFDERLKFTEDNMDKVIDSATSPLDGQRWWLQAEDCWQALATCFELHSAMQSPNPAEYVSQLPIHMDGSCNGLQHYAALGGDIEGGKSVNLVPADAPQDVYSEVLKYVNAMIDEDAAKNDPVALRVQGKVKRKTIKQTVMTTVYGVTFIGARQQIWNQLKDQLDTDGPLELNEEKEMYEESMYIAKKTFLAVEQMFTGAKLIMSWLAACARVTAINRQPTQWMTPLGLPVVQPYRRPGKMQVKTALQYVTLTTDNDLLPVSVHKQQSAFPPNYVHSLDATHMFMTAFRCRYVEDITFAAVHDSFWTHACDVQKLNKSLREAFVDLHSRPLLQDLKQQFEGTIPNGEFPEIPSKGKLDINIVKESPYFFQ